MILKNNLFYKYIERCLREILFPGTVNCWEKVYASGGNSGRGSYGMLATYKANFVNAFVKKNRVRSVIEFGCGDGNQLRFAKYPKYIGLDVSATAIKKCMKIFRHDTTKSFFLYNPEYFIDKVNVFKCDLSISLDVIFHLVEDDLYEKYMYHLFQSADKFVIIYSSNTEDNALSKGFHIMHHEFTGWVKRNIAG